MQAVPGGSREGVVAWVDAAAEQWPWVVVLSQCSSRLLYRYSCALGTLTRICSTNSEESPTCHTRVGLSSTVTCGAAKHISAAVRVLSTQLIHSQPRPSLPPLASSRSW